MKSGRIAALAAAIVLAAGSSVATVGVGTASAQTYTYLCLNNLQDVTYCAVANGSSAIKMEEGLNPGTTTNWYWSSSRTQSSTIEQAATDPAQCMQVDADGGDIVIMAACSSSDPSYQQWVDIAPTGAGYLQFESEWGPAAECLTYDQDQQELKVGGCGNDWYQQFYAE
jgi:hypothetical protein